MPAPTRTRTGLRAAIARLEAFYGRPARPPATDPFGLVIWENCAYLVDDARRAAVFKRLKSAVGLEPGAILATPLPALAGIIEQGGMLPLHRAAKLHAAAEIALEVGPAALRRVAERPPNEAKRLLRRFPGIGEPGADRILLFCRGQHTLGPDSNALRVLVRLGYGKASDNYQRTYRSAAAAVAPELPSDFAWSIKAHQLLRRHGQELCKRAAPRCDACPLASACPWYLNRAQLLSRRASLHVSLRPRRHAH
jgi:endonuclease-3